MRGVVRCLRLSWMIPPLCPVVAQPLFPQQRLWRRWKVRPVRMQEERMLGQTQTHRLRLRQSCTLRRLLRWMYRGMRREEVEETEEQNLKAQRLGIGEVVIVRGLSRPPASTYARRARQPARRARWLPAYLTP